MAKNFKQTNRLNYHADKIWNRTALPTCTQNASLHTWLKRNKCKDGKLYTLNNVRLVFLLLLFVLKDPLYTQETFFFQGFRTYDAFKDQCYKL
jgi:hypothetical protein